MRATFENMRLELALYMLAMKAIEDISRVIVLPLPVAIIHP